MYEFMVPSPGAFLIESLKRGHARTVDVVKPADFILTPDQITEDNYYFWVQEYGAADIEPPPAMYKTKTISFKGNESGYDTDISEAQSVTLDDDYSAHFAWIIAPLVNHTDGAADVVLGQHHARFTGSADWSWNGGLDGEVGTIPFALTTFKIRTISVAGEIH